VLWTATEAFDTQASLLHEYSSQTDQTIEVTLFDVYGRVTESFNGTVTLLRLIGWVNFVVEKHGCQLVIVNMADINSDDSICSDIVIEVGKRKQAFSVRFTIIR
jgi:hypothetical protein